MAHIVFVSSVEENATLTLECSGGWLNNRYYTNKKQTHPLDMTQASQIRNNTSKVLSLLTAGLEGEAVMDVTVFNLQTTMHKNTLKNTFNAPASVQSTYRTKLSVIFICLHISYINT